MGIGDNLLSCGEARSLHKKSGRKVLIRRPDAKIIWDDVWDGVPFLLRKPDPVNPHETYVSGAGIRAYIERKTPEQWFWRPYTPKPAVIVFTPDELSFAEPWRGCVMVEPNGKSIGHDNKLWSWENWTMLAAWSKDRLVQCGPAGTRLLPGVEHAPTATFRQAAAVLSVCRAFIGGDGGLHHAAAAVGTPAVVIRGGFISEKVTGYASHKNLFTGTGLGCGMRTNCLHCRKAMSRITVDDVASALKGIT